eukprot:1189234-Prorocentrum_minimum.AAC.2
MVRMFFHLRYDVRNTTTFSRLALFQMGADWYSYHDVFDAFVVGGRQYRRHAADYQPHVRRPEQAVPRRAGGGASRRLGSLQAAAARRGCAVVGVANPSPLVQLVPATGIFSLPLRDWCPLRVDSLSPCAIGACYG